MFCFQCEQAAKGSGCTVNGVCGKKEDVAHLQDVLTGELIGLARTCAAHKESAAAPDETVSRLLIDGLFTTVTNVSFDGESVQALTAQVQQEKTALANRLGVEAAPAVDLDGLWEAPEDLRTLKSLVLFGLRGMAAYAYHAWVLGKRSQVVESFFVKGLCAIGEETAADVLLQLSMELGEVNLQCMALLDEANTSTYGAPSPTKVSCDVEPGPFIVVSGHDLHDLKLLLEQTEGKGVNIYTHSEMLPAHGYPELRKYAHLKGNFGTAWHTQQKEFDGIPAPILFTTNCLMPPKPNYADRVFTTALVQYPGLVHIGKDKDFTPVIEKAIALGGYKEKKTVPGMNGGSDLTTGFGHQTVLSVADKVIAGVKSGKIKHFFLVGGCDGAKSGRSYYTDFVKQTPKDSLILTLGCGKYRFNDLALGEIDGLPRVLDMGQCNDAYGAIQVAVALAKAFDCSVNDLPLTLVLAWYEQKAVCILLTLLALGIKNIYIGPSLPAFVSPNILQALVEKWNLTPISTPEADLKKILG